MLRKSWDRYYFDIAEQVAERSPCLSKKIGAVLVRDRVIICEGYNGPARGVAHCGKDRLKDDYILRHRAAHDAFEPLLYDPETTCPRKCLGYLPGQGLEFCPAVHAEANCISNAARMGIKTKGSTMFVTCEIPCKDCLSLIINAGVVEVIVTKMSYYDTLSRFIIGENSERISIKVYEF